MKINQFGTSRTKHCHIASILLMWSVVTSFIKGGGVTSDDFSGHFFFRLFYFVVAICDLVRDMETIFHLSCVYLLANFCQHIYIYRYIYICDRDWA